MADGSLCGTGLTKSKQKQITDDFLNVRMSNGWVQSYLTELASVVSKHSGEKIHLKKYKFRVGSLEDTSYKNNTDILEEWEQFYLEKEKKMVVIGVLENFPCGEDSAELVLMVCEDTRVFAYEDEHLHLVASSLKELFESGVQFPSSEYYYRGQSFEKMTKDDWNEVKNSEEAKEKRQKHKDMLESIKPTLLKNLEIIKQRQQGKTLDQPPSEKSEMCVPLPVS